jgi:hypothetical protein
VILPLRHDALKAELAGVLKHERPVFLGQVLVEAYARGSAGSGMRSSVAFCTASGSCHPAISRLQKSGHDGQGSVCAAAQRVLMNLDVPWRSR